MSAPLLSTLDVAGFAARGFLALEGVVPDAINRRFAEEGARAHEYRAETGFAHYDHIARMGGIPTVAPGTPLERAFPANSVVRALLDVPEVAGAIVSLVGQAPVVDHQFLHIAFPEAAHKGTPVPHAPQPLHQDSTIDPRRAFDIQLMYYPAAVTAEMGGTRYLPGSHLRLVSEAAIARYQNLRGQQHVVCPAGTVMVMHHGIWHGGGVNRSPQPRYMYKIRLCPTAPQVRLWDTHDLPDGPSSRPIFWTGGAAGDDPITAALMQVEPWYEADTGRLEMMNRIRLWRYLTGNEAYDADYWMTRVENEF